MEISKIESIAYISTSDKDKISSSNKASPIIMRKFRRSNDDRHEEDRPQSPSTIKRALTKRRSFLKHPFFKDVERKRSKTWGPGSVLQTYAIDDTSQDTEVKNETEKLRIKKMKCKHKTEKKLKELVAKVLKKNLEYCSYNANLSRTRCTYISQILETIFRSTLNLGDLEYKILALVYIGEIRDDGVRQSFQHNENVETDFFILETYRKGDMFATGVVFAALLEEQEDT